MNKMLQAFVGTFDSAGLRSLRSESDGAQLPNSRRGLIPFWAIIDSHELPPICNALTVGERTRALQLLLQSARSFGPVDV